MISNTAVNGFQDDSVVGLEDQRHSLQLALDSLEKCDLTVTHLKRVAVERDGTLHMESDGSGLARWFSYEGSTLHELWPHDDKSIPLLARGFVNDSALDQVVISYRPGRRIVLGLTDSGGERIIKGYKRQKCQQAAGCHAIALSACQGGGFKVPHLVEYAEDADYLVMAKQAGSSPDTTTESKHVWADIGACLRQFQLSRVDDSLPEFSSRDELDVLDERARRFLLCAPRLPANWQRGRDLLEDLMQDLPAASFGLAHRDLHDGQFLVDGEVISLLDFDLLCKADMALDAGNLLAHLVLRELQAENNRGANAASFCSDAFLEGLARYREPGFNQRLLYYQATSFYRLALLYALRPRWAHLTDTLISRGSQCINACRGG